MYFNPMFFQQPMIRNNKSYILDLKKGDVNGDKGVDYVYLIGDKADADKSLFTVNIRIKIVDPRTGKQYTIPLKENAGYNPTIFLGDFTGDGVDNIFVAIASGGSGGYAFYYIYSFLKNKPKLMFDSEEFYKDNPYEVNYMNNYNVEVIEESDQERYIINIEDRGDEYLSKIYNEDGTLKESISGWVNPLGGLYPIDFNRDGVYGLYAEQSIAGTFNADTLGYVQTSLEWKGNSFLPFFQTVGIGSEEYNI
ncbi:VCBS repeat-containing protein [Tepidibacter hydrothermalis]|uniref:VCBS repeat-containing protein n=1 Tax=Tepidibacter hydrothermalis TaxID=3036126 RepID=A0ABY8EEG1_9FIRM|nr:VCBS repeat-containing protein [Tepidibacter hydrothermalis]WFD10169.1 VCBS repeat-containing protein [Tepidibacter hydrothermalis]